MKPRSAQCSKHFKTTVPSVGGPSRPVLPSHACHEGNASGPNHLTLPKSKDHKALSEFILFYIPSIAIPKFRSSLHPRLAPRVAARAKSARMVSGWKPFTFGAKDCQSNLCMKIQKAQ